MITIFDATTLALTKLKTRKVRTFFTVFIAGLLFSGVFSVLLISQGFFQSADSFAKEGMVGRYIISAQDASMFRSFGNKLADPTTDPELIAKAKAEYDALVAKKKREAKRLGVDYDPATERSPLMENIEKPGTKILDYSSPIAQKIILENQKGQDVFATLTTLQQVAKDYHPRALYETRTVSPLEGSLSEMKNGKENFSPATEQPQAGPSGNMAMIGEDMQEITLAPQPLLSLYMIENHTWKPASGNIPVVVTQKRAATLLKYPTPKSDAPAKQRLAYAQELKKRATGLTFTSCYRNTVSQSQITQAVTVAKEIAANKNNRDYVKPSLIYGTPDPTSCAAAVVVADTRTADEKLMTSKQNEFRRLFGESVDPVQRKITYEVVGIAPNSYMDTMDGGLAAGVGDILATVLASQTFRFAIPEDLYNQLPNKDDLKDIYSDHTQTGMQLYAQLYAEFADADSAKKFMKSESCSFDMNGGCVPTDKKFMLSPFGSNSIALDDAKVAVDKTLTVATLLVMAVAGVIAGLTIGRTIADGRRETAVFRAIGFKRSDIAQIYTTYTLFLCVGIVGVSFLIGYGCAAAVDAFNWVNATTTAQVALGVTDTMQQFHFVGFSSKLLWVVLAIVLSALLGMMLPLIRNVRRSPIRDMRDE